MDAALRFGNGDALYAVHAALVLEVPVDPLSADRDRDLLVTARIGLGRNEQLQRVVTPFCVALVDAEQVGREQGRLVAARASADLEHHVLAIVRVPGNQHPPQATLDLAQLELVLRDFFPRELADVGVVVAQQLLAVGERRPDPLPALVGLDPLADPRQLGGHLAQPARLLGSLGPAKELLQLPVARHRAFQPLEQGRPPHRESGRAGAAGARAGRPVASGADEGAKNPEKPGEFANRGAPGRTLLAPSRVAAIEALHLASGVHQLLLAGVERVAIRADLHADLRGGRPCLELVPTGAVHLGENVFRVDIGLHGKGPR